MLYTVHYMTPCHITMCYVCVMMRVVGQVPTHGSEHMHANVQKETCLLEGALRGKSEELGNQLIRTHDGEMVRKHWQR